MLEQDQQTSKGLYNGDDNFDDMLAGGGMNAMKHEVDKLRIENEML